MLRFGVIAEGPCDQLVIENILLGYFQDEEEEPVINFVQPPPPTTGSPPSPGGWTLVFRSLERGDVQQALQFNDYIVIQIDTDVQEEPGFAVPRREGGKELPLPDRVKRVRARLIKDVDAGFYQATAHRILFAVAVDTIECWLLPLLYKNKKAEKTTGCLQAANAELRRTKRDGLSAGDDTKFPRGYEQASRDYRKRKKLLEHRNRNPSLEIFIQQLDALQSQLTANQSAPPQEPDKAPAESEKPPEDIAGNQPEQGDK